MMGREEHKEGRDTAAGGSSGRSGKPVIGLAGGIGSGKSLVARQLASLGCGVIDSDALAREALEDEQVRGELVRWWGPAVIDAGGKVDRGAVGRIVFSDAEARKRLESLVHPRIHRERARLRAGMETDEQVVAIVEDAPLLFEVGLDAECDIVIFVAASRDTRLRRVRTSRGWEEAELDRRERQQQALDFKAERADYVVDNDGSELETFSHVRRVLSEILQRFN